MFVWFSTGTGASCIYPLLGAQTRGWHFIATEADPTNVEYAVENVARNDLSTKIRGKCMFC